LLTRILNQVSTINNWNNGGVQQGGMSNETEKHGTKLQRVYELLGAPSLLYRQESTAFAEPPPQENDASLFQEYLQSRRRAQARWYYPIDHHVLKPTLPKLSIEMLEKMRTKIRVHRRVDGQPVEEMKDDSGNNEEDQHQHEKEGNNTGPRRLEEGDDNNEDAQHEKEVGEGDPTDKGDNTRVSKQKAKGGTSEIIYSQDYFQQQSLPLLQEARAYMLLPLAGEKNENLEEEEQVRNKVHSAVQNYQLYDASYVPARARKKGKVRGPKVIPPQRVRDTQRYSRERQDFGDPAYLAPFDTKSVRETMVHDEASRTVEEDWSGGSTRRRRTPTFLATDPNSPTKYGNCLVSFACPCPVCENNTEHSWCLLHPTGTLLDLVRLSYLHLPNADGPTTMSLDACELDVGDGVRQLTQCGPTTFAARTCLHVVIFRVMVEPPKQETESTAGCWGTARLHEIHRIDARSISRDGPSYRPRDVSSHPKYANSWTDPKIAILYESDRGARNVIRHSLVGKTLRSSEHVISNLQDIFEVDFSSHHPMVLWAAGRSYVRPVLAADYLSMSTKQFRSGHGSSLFSIDLRSNQATFQWSPSAEEFVMEGIHSLSGIMTDWVKENTVWVSSVSAGKTWEIDTRMPCRAISSWSLPGSCDDFAANLPATGLHGAGTLLAQPSAPLGTSHLLTPRPILSVGKSPETFGMHLYQRPDIRPRFQTQSVECASCPGLPVLGEMSVATSSIYALPDVSEDVFTCGLAPFRAPVSSFFTSEIVTDMGYSEKDVTGVVYAITMTNKGDLYTHSLLESTAGHTRSKLYEGLPIGTSALAVPGGVQKPPTAFDSLGIRISLQNDFPVPSRAIFQPPSASQGVVSSAVYSTCGDTANDEPMQKIEPSALCHAIVAGRDMKVNCVHLPVRLLEASRVKVSSAVDCFDHERKSVVETGDVDGQWRSDITPLILESQAWVESEDSE
jgi:hypothetical protein